MYHDDEDLHMCIYCHATIVGLENYISHRNAGACKQQTPVKENEAPIPVLPPLGMPKSEHIRSLPSATTPSGGDHLNFLNADFFFSSLELQSRRKDVVFEEVMGIEEVLEEEFEEREGQGMVHVGGGKWSYEDYVQDRTVWGGMEEKRREMGEIEREDVVGGGRIASKCNVKKGGGKTGGEDRDMSRRRRLRASSEMEENNPDFMDGLGSGADFSLGEQSSSKCHITPRDTLLTSRTHDFHGSSDAGNCNASSFSLPLDGCEMGIGNSSLKDDRESLERNSAAPPQSHTRGKWVPGLASEGMRKSGNAVEYFCQPCNKNIRNRRSYETHLSTLCHLKKLMSSSSNKISAHSTEGPRLRSRRLQGIKPKDISSTAKPTIHNLNKSFDLGDEGEHSSTCDLNSQNYLMESLGIKRKVGVPDSDEKNCGSMNVRETITSPTGDNLSSISDKCKRDISSSRNQNVKKISNVPKNINRKNKRKSKLKKRISKIHKEADQLVDSQKCFKDDDSHHSNVTAQSQSVETGCRSKILKKHGHHNPIGDDRGDPKDNKSLFVEERHGLVAEDKFLPISDPLISHGYYSDSLEIQEKQKKSKEKFGLDKQRCESNSHNSSENLQDKMMLGLELMRTEHLLSSSDKLESKEESLCKGENMEMRNKILAEALNEGTVNAKLVSYDVCGRNTDGEALVENLPDMRKEDLNHPLENLVNEEICRADGEMIFGHSKLPGKCQSGTNSYGENETTSFQNHDSINERKLFQQSEERSNSFSNSFMVGVQSEEFIETTKDLTKITKENNSSKSLEPLGKKSVSVVLGDDLVFNSPKRGQNLVTVKLVKMKNLSTNASKHFSDGLLKNLVDFTCDVKNSILEELCVNKSEVHHNIPDYLLNSGNSSMSSDNSLNSDKHLSQFIANLPPWAKNNSKLLIVKQNVNQVMEKSNVHELKGKILVVNKSAINKYGNLPELEFQSEKKNKDSTCDRFQEKKLCFQPSQALLCQIIRPEASPRKECINTREECIIGEVSNSHISDELIPEKKVDGHCIYSADERNGSTMAESIVLGIASSECAGQISLVEGDLQMDRLRNCSGSPENKMEPSSPTIDDVFTVHCGKGDDLISSDNQVAYEEVVDSCQTCVDSCPTVNVVINVKNMNSKNDEMTDISVITDPVENDFAGSSSGKCNSSQYISFTKEKLLPSRTCESSSGQKSQRFNANDAVFDAKCVGSESGERVHVNECCGESGEQSNSRNMSDSDVMGISANRRGIIEQVEPGKGIQYSCQICKYKSNRYWCVERHMKKHFPRDRPYSCSKCGLSFLTMDNLKQHLKRHKKRRWCCNIKNCSQAFSTKHELLAHISGPHVDEKSFKCHLCDYSGKNLPALIRHKKVHEIQPTEKCETCSQVFKKGNLRRHMKIHGKNDLYHCPFCSFTSYYLTSVHRHVTNSGLHPDKMLYNCPFCTVVEDDVEQHEEMEHSYCLTSSSFSSDGIHEMMNHINSAHKEEKVYSYVHSNITEIIRKIHILLGIIRLPDG
ncbi:uncharacterized protein LOC124165546 [Ischnura elegans]|uniref:uncharacterized protein LOC124165546 n=1 Tax=Ischnura elegans TaxID=197161 RepID=UPI001ED89339|nr:uncharacterized protein LOC124165546 [Ischnura elegans]